MISREEEQANKFVNHARTQEQWQIEMKGKSNNQVVQEFDARPVCERCERIAMRHMGHAKCPHCGWEGKLTSLSDYMKNKSYK
jgi:rRNA maturation endonuclease Nob1